MVINTNSAAQRAANNLNDSQEALGKSLSRLSSGNRIVNPSDDAAGLAVSSRLAAQISLLQAARDNVANATSFTQTQDGYLKSTDAALIRMGELAMLAKDPTKSPSDRSLYDAEFQQLKSFIRETVTREQNGTALFDGGQWNVTQDSDGNTFDITKPDLTANVYNDAISGNRWLTTIDTWQTSKFGFITEVDIWKNSSGQWQLTDPSGTAVKVSAGSFLSDKPTIDNPLIDLPFGGEAKDESGNGFSATISGATLTTDRNGKANSAYLFDGVDDYIEIESTTTQLDVQNGTFTAWIKSDPSGHEVYGSGEIGGIIDRSSQWAHLRLIDDKPSFASNLPYQETESTTALSRDTWHFVVATYDGADKKIYIDGALDTTDSVGAGKLDWADSKLIIGKEVSGHFKGAIDDVRVYNKALTATQVSQLYNNGQLDDVASSASKGAFVSIDPTSTGNGEDVNAIKHLAGTEVTDDPTSVDPGAIPTTTGTHLKDIASAGTAMGLVQTASQQAALDRAGLGASQARMQAVNTQLTETKHNLTLAKSRITDVDVAEEATEFARRQILVQSGTQMLTEANSLPEMALQLLQGLRR